MSVNETIMINKLRRSKTLSLLLVVLFTLSTMSLPACSGDDDGISQRVVQATVYFNDEGPAAMAWVQDGAKNFVSDAILSINDRTFELTFLGDEASDEDSVPIYYLELHDLKGGDSLTLVAKRSDGTLIYAPPSAQIPMSLELVEPAPDQPIIPGEEVVVRWAGGEGSTHVAAFYADDLGEEQYINVQKFGDVEAITVPQGIVRGGGGIIGAAALSGDHHSFQVDSGDDQLESSFVVYRDEAIEISDRRLTPPVAGSRGCKPSTNGTGVCCPDAGVTAGPLICIAEFAAIVGLIVWKARYHLDAKSYPKCPAGPIPALPYCGDYSACFSHTVWVRGCMCPQGPGRPCYP